MDNEKDNHTAAFPKMRRIINEGDRPVSTEPVAFVLYDISHSQVLRQYYTLHNYPFTDPEVIPST